VRNYDVVTIVPTRAATVVETSPEIPSHAKLSLVFARTESKVDRMTMMTDEARQVQIL
jgi:hypothetical protein